MMENLMSQVFNSIISRYLHFSPSSIGIGLPPPESVQSTRFEFFFRLYSIRMRLLDRILVK
jgi:hypothetical protein